MAGDLKLKVQYYTKTAFENPLKWSYNEGDLKIKVCKIEGLLYNVLINVCKQFFFFLQTSRPPLNRKNKYP